MRRQTMRLERNSALNLQQSRAHMKRTRVEQLATAAPRARALKQQPPKPLLKVGWWGVLTLKPGVAPLRCYLGQIQAISDDGIDITLRINPGARFLYSASQYPECPRLQRRARPRKLQRPSRQLATPK
jgi:hypothetical protein